MKIFFIIFLISLFNFRAVAQDYFTIKNSGNIIELLRSEGIDENHLPEQIEYNYAFVYSLTEGKILVASGNYSEAILFYSERSFFEALNKKEFPIEDPPSIFASDRKLLEKPGDHLDLFLKRLMRFGITEYPHFQDHMNALDDLSNSINRIGVDNLSNSELVAISVFFGELIRRELNGNWKSFKEYSINPYYTIDIVDDIGYINYTNELFHHLWSGENVSLIKAKKRLDRQIAMREW